MSFLGEHWQDGMADGAVAEPGELASGESLGPIKGIMLGLALSVPGWVLIFFVVRWAVRFVGTLLHGNPG